MKCKFCVWEPPALRKDGHPMMDSARTDRLQQHMSHEHPAEWKQFRDARFRSGTKSIETERTLTKVTEERPRPKRWDLYGNRT